jgi:hypothetical protein
MNWKYWYKIYEDRPRTTNMLYTPMINDEGDTLLMKWDAHEPYQSGNKGLTTELIDFFFEREVKYINMFKDKPWCPNIKEINIEEKKVYIEFNKETLNTILFTPGRDLNVECPDWKEQIFEIIKDITDSGYYKMALYPHCFFIDTQGKIKTIDYYSFIERSNPFIERTVIQGIIGNDSNSRFNNSTDSGVVNFETFFKITLKDHLKNNWPDNPFPDYYKRLFND